MGFFKSKAFIFCLIAAILLALVPTTIAAFGGTDLLRSALGTISKPFTMCASGIANAFNGFVNVFTQYDELKAENEELRAELDALRQKEYNEDLLREQNKWLKDYINIHEANPALQFADAAVISREAGNYETVLTLNKGSVHGVRKNMAVLTADGLVGHVSEIGLDWFRVSTIIEPSSSMGVYTEKENMLGVLEGDSTLEGNGTCRMTYISGKGNLSIGDKVYTAGGEGSTYPTGLYVGTVSDFGPDATTGEMVATITPAVDFARVDSISGVMIVLNRDNGGT
jgi:rod shape-determining protein MreC